MSEENELLIEETAEAWIMDKCENWRDHFQSNYQDKFDEYYRLWRGVWSGEDSLRQSERSRLINPALQQAVESSVAEVEEATFGRGQFFDIHDDMNDPERIDIDYLKKKLLLTVLCSELVLVRLYCKKLLDVSLVYSLHLKGLL
jgi:hypothetical protein